MYAAAHVVMLVMHAAAHVVMLVMHAAHVVMLVMLVVHAAYSALHDTVGPSTHLIGVILFYFTGSVYATTNLVICNISSDGA